MTDKQLADLKRVLTAYPLTRRETHPVLAAIDLAERTLRTRKRGRPHGTLHYSPELDQKISDRAAKLGRAVVAREMNVPIANIRRIQDRHRKRMEVQE